MKKRMKKVLESGMTGEALVVLVIAWLIGMLVLVSRAAEASTGLSMTEQIYQALFLLGDW